MRQRIEERWPCAIAIALALFALALFLFTRGRDFPFYYHPDEPGKTDQVLTRDYNFHHPLLLLVSTEMLLGSSRTQLEAQQVVEAGRLVSAIFAACAVAALALLAWLRRGWLAAVAAGLLLAFHQQLFELAHYMKEDPALLAGVALTFLALAGYQRWPAWQTALLCGAACGLAISGKYMGAVLLAFALPVLVLARRELPAARRAAHVALLLGGLAVLLAVINLPLLRDAAEFEASLGREVDLVVQGSKGMTRSVPHAHYLNIFVDNTTPLIWLLLGCYYACFWRRRREEDAAAWATALFPIVFTLLLSLSPKTNDRYFLPVSAILYYLAALGLVDLATVLLPRWKPSLQQHATRIGAALLLLAVASELPRFVDVYQAFRRDDGRELLAFVVGWLPPNAKIAQDNRVQLPDPARRKRHRSLPNPLTQTVVSGKRYAAELGESLEELRAQGFTHVAVSESSYGRFFLESMRPLESYEEEYARLRGFYEQLFREGKLLFERPRSTVVYLHPGLQLYQIATAPAATP